MGGGDGGEGIAGGAHLSVITAITLSGCSLLFLALLRSRLAQKEEGLEPPPGSALVSSVVSTEANERKKKKKKENVGVRFSEDVGHHHGNGAEPRTRLRARSAPDRPDHGGRQAEDPQERKGKTVLGGGAGVASGGENTPIPANRRALYRGMCQYRSQMATLMLYHA